MLFESPNLHDPQKKFCATQFETFYDMRIALVWDTIASNVVICSPFLSK